MRHERSPGVSAFLSAPRRFLKRFHPEGIPAGPASFYNKISATGVFQHHYRLVAKDIAGRCSEGSLLDVGTGPGWLLLKIHEEAPQLRLVGSDISRAMVSKARQNIQAAGLSESIQLSESGVPRMPFPDASFDVVVSTGSLHHWKDPVAGLNEIHRILKPGAPALIYDIVSNTPKPLLAEMSKEFGRLRTWLFWIHAFEEPFFTDRDIEALAGETLFGSGKARFVGMICCLDMVKKDG